MGGPEEGAWKAFGFYVRRQMGMGRGITIPHFGAFTFSAPDVTLPGVTNPQDRDKQIRNPVFLISKDFANGIFLQTGIFIDGHVRAFKVFLYSPKSIKLNPILSGPHIRKHPSDKSKLD